MPSPHLAGGPTPLALADLRLLVRQHAERVAAGLHPVRHHPRDRWYVRLHSDDFTDVWLISWPRDTSTELHDHAGSLGALTVVSGELTEYRWVRDHSARAGALAVAGAGARAVGGSGVSGVSGRPGTGRLVGRRLAAGRGAAFPLGHVHDVVNASTAPAVSVHAYSPPLTAMSYYAPDASGLLRRTRTVLTDEPEPAAAGVPA
ncbi:cysteine dioxygenase [Allostreptomyces psammosilenae]|uniref:Cysteine dioxygenase n=1 Tax=Allostreptomyces psammosilenae TaxID=1892865 RepID=A0A852ZPZ1_9ACTN|nr:cysteine dioxygenase family protein [Allostreptomyces psammosilenae]NYI04463.1 hypothetical protein [Allostreptomyces psammosilenae]